MYTTQQVAARLGLARQNVHRLAAKAGVTPRILARRAIWLEPDVNRLVAWKAERDAAYRLYRGTPTTGGER